MAYKSQNRKETGKCKKVNRDVFFFEEMEDWQSILKETFDGIYTYDICGDYNYKKINNKIKKYKVICLSEPHNKEYKYYTFFNLILSLRDYHPELPLILVLVEANPRFKCPNIKQIIIKTGNSFIFELEDALSRFLRHRATHIDNGIKIKPQLEKTKGDAMIIELLTIQTVGAGMKFLFDRLGKLVDRLNEKQLASIKVAESVTNEQELELAKESMRELRNIKPEIDSMNSFAEWVQAKIDEDFANLLEVDELLVVVLRKKREEESNPIKKANILKIEAKLKILLNNFKNGGGVFEEKEQEQLYGLIMSVLDFLKKAIPNKGDIGQKNIHELPTEKYIDLDLFIRRDGIRVHSEEGERSDKILLRIPKGLLKNNLNIYSICVIYSIL